MLVALATFLAPHATDAASTGIVETAATTYQLVPAKDLVQVTIDVRVENHVPSTSTSVPCFQYVWDPYYGYIPVMATCTTTTKYYVNTAEIWVEDAAQHLAIKANSGTVSTATEKHQSGFRLVKLTFARTYYAQVRTLHVTYQLLGGKPRSGDTVRAGKAYASFCATGNGPQGGSITVIVPQGFDFETTGDSVTQSTSGTSTVYRSGSLSDSLDFYVCLDGTDEAAYQRATVTASDGRSVIVEAWPEDPTWFTSVQAQAKSSLDGLEALIGRPLPGSGPITVRETSSNTLGDYVGDFDPSTMVANVDEDLSQLDTVPHELAHDWFNSSLFSDVWLSEGYAEWAATSVGAGVPACTDPGTSPGTTTPNIENWVYLGPKATDAQLSVVQYDYAASCYVVTQLANAAGTANMRAAVQYMLDRKVPYMSDSPDRLPAGPLTWRQWLDIVDEVAMVPAAADPTLGQSLMTRFGVDTDATELAARTAARAAYHAFADAAADWSMPTFISKAMSNWRFSDATAALQVATSIRSLAEQTDQALPGANGMAGTVKTKFEAASSLADLKAVQQVAQDQLAAAKVVATADTSAAEARGPVESVGLMGTDLAAMTKAGVHAISVGDSQGARTDAAQLTDVLQGAANAGLIRLGGGTVVVVLVLGGSFFLLRRRRRPAAVAVTSEAAVAEATPTEPSADPLLAMPMAEPGPTVPVEPLAGPDQPDPGPDPGAPRSG